MLKCSEVNCEVECEVGCDRSPLMTIYYLETKTEKIPIKTSDKMHKFPERQLGL